MSTPAPATPTTPAWCSRLSWYPSAEPGPAVGDIPPRETLKEQLMHSVLRGLLLETTPNYVQKLVSDIVRLIDRYAVVADTFSNMCAVRAPRSFTVRVVTEANLRRHRGVFCLNTPWDNTKSTMDACGDEAGDGVLVDVFQGLPELAFFAIMEGVTSIPAHRQRIWRYAKRHNATQRPHELLIFPLEPKTRGTGFFTYQLLVEDVARDAGLQRKCPVPLPPQQVDRTREFVGDKMPKDAGLRHLLLFIKIFDPVACAVSLLGYTYVRDDVTPRMLMSLVRSWHGHRDKTVKGDHVQYKFVEEIKPTKVVAVDLDKDLLKLDLRTGDILCVQEINPQAGEGAIDVLDFYLGAGIEHEAATAAKTAEPKTL